MAEKAIIEPAGVAAGGAGQQQHVSSGPPVEDLLQTTPLQNCQRLVVLGSARSGKSSLVARYCKRFYLQVHRSFARPFCHSLRSALST